MKTPLLGFVLRQVKNSLWQFLWGHLLTAATMAVTLFVFGAFMLLQMNLERLLKGWGDQIQLTAYLAKNADGADVQSLLQQVRSLPEVSLVRLTSREQAWRDFQTALGAQSGLLDGLPRDLLPASLEIEFKPAQRDSAIIEQFAQRLRTEKEVTSVEYPQEWVERLSLIVLALQWAKWIFGGLLFLATFFIVGNAVKLALLARKEEVEIMQLVGASEQLIQAPFVIEGVVQGLTAGAISLAMLWGMFVFLGKELPTVAGFLAPLSRPEFLDTTSIAMLLAIGSLLGGGGSLFSLRRFIKTWKASGRAA